MANNSVSEICLKMPPEIDSKGIGEGRLYNPYSYSLPRLEIQMALILLVSHAFHSLLKKLGIPIFISQIIAGMVIAPVLRYHAEQKEIMEGTQVLGTLAALGFALFIFVSAVKTDLSIIKNSGIRPLCIGLLSFSLPMALSTGLVYVVQISGVVKLGRNLSFMTAIYSMTSFPVVAMLLGELRLLNSELGRLGLASALVADLLGMTTTVGSALVVGDRKEGFENLGAGLFFLGVVTILLRPAMKWVVSNTPQDKQVKDFYVYAVLLCCLVALFLTGFKPVFLIVCPYILGLAVPEGPPLGSAVVNKIEYIVSNLLVPIYASTVSMRFTFSSLNFQDETMLVSIIVGISTLLLKFCLSFLMSRFLYKMPAKDAAALALIMNTKGIVETGLYSTAYDNKVLPDSLYTSASIIFICMATIVPIFVKLLHDPSRKYAGYEKRNLMSLRPNSELQIVACIHVPNDVNPTINVLQAACPSRENPIAVKVLHLIKLAGRTSPLFISHQKQPKSVSEVSYFKNATILFYQFEKNNWGTVSVNSYTAVSPPSSMQEDICNLALDNQASLILLPFHQRWYRDGTVESEDTDVRTLNSMILETSPCSIGILLDRSALRHSIPEELTSISISQGPSFKVAMIFLGGDDDREALTFAKRMAQDGNAALSVMFLKPATKEGPPEWDSINDSLLLREVKSTPGLRFMETEVQNGSETSMILRSVAQKYDLVVVGRRNNLNSLQTSGLKEWSVFLELGVIGDLLASPDLEGTCSILVIQQQKTNL